MRVLLFSTTLIKTGEKNGILDKNNKNEFLTMMKSKEHRRFLTIFRLSISNSKFELGDAILNALRNGKCRISDKIVSLIKF